MNAIKLGRDPVIQYNKLYGPKYNYLDIEYGEVLCMHANPFSSHHRNRTQEARSSDHRRDNDTHAGSRDTDHFHHHMRTDQQLLTNRRGPH